jgi:hypothetical protein
MDTPPQYPVADWLKHRVSSDCLGEGSARVWVPTGDFETSSLRRVPRYPTEDGPERPEQLWVQMGQDDTRAGQLAILHRDGLRGLRTDVSDLVAEDGATIDASHVTVRYPGYVPVVRPGDTCSIAGSYVAADGDPDLVADPLFATDAVDVRPYRVQPIWLTVSTPAEAAPGTYAATITIDATDSEPTALDLVVDLADVSVPAPTEGAFTLDLWCNPDAVATAHEVDPWSDAHWDLLDAYLEALAAAGQDYVTVPIVHEPWQVEWHDGWRSQTATPYSWMVEWHYDGETWSFDYDRFDAYVERSLAAGIGPAISTYSMLTFQGDQRITYLDAAGDLTVERTTVDDPRWREAWTAFLESFRDHLADQGWLEQTWLAFDEKPSEQLDAATALVADVAPTFLDRLKMAVFTQDEIDHARAYALNYDQLPIEAGEPAADRPADETGTFYTSVGHDHPNTFSHSPAVESALLPWLAERHDLDGYTRWSFTSWPDEPLQNPAHRHPQGDEYLIYPGPDGPRSSIRWELFQEGLRDVALCREARERGFGDAVDKAVSLATAEIDGREADPSAVKEARRRIYDVLDNS